MHESRSSVFEELLVDSPIGGLQSVVFDRSELLVGEVLEVLASSDEFVLVGELLVGEFELGLDDISGELGPLLVLAVTRESS